MAEKGVSKESLSRRLSRKRNSFLEERECKKRRGSNTGEDKERSIDVRPGLQAGPSSDLVGGTSPSDSDGNDERDIESGCVAGGGCVSLRCDRSFFDVDCETLAQDLLGCVLVRRSSSGGREIEFRGRIVETEAYLGKEDKAAHSFEGKRTERNSAMFMQPGTAYVYSIYGMHCCFNISSHGEGAAVLVRALEPVLGMEGMRERRKTAKKDKDLCNGPAKLCQAMDIDKSFNKINLVSSDTLWVEPCGSPIEAVDVVKSGRVGVDYAGEWAEMPLRFYIKANSCVSKK